MINETVQAIVIGLTTSYQNGTPIWVIVLSVFGLFYVAGTLMKTGTNLITAGAYLIGLFYWVYQLFKHWRR